MGVKPLTLDTIDLKLVEVKGDPEVDTDVKVNLVNEDPLTPLDITFRMKGRQYDPELFSGKLPLIAHVAMEEPITMNSRVEVLAVYAGPIRVYSASQG